MIIRKTIDYFCHLAKNPADFSTIQADEHSQFVNTPYFEKIRWIKGHNKYISLSPLIIPIYSGLPFTSKFLQKLPVIKFSNLFSGRDFETRDYKEEIAEESYKNT